MKINWSKIKRYYILNDISLEELAKKFKVSLSAANKHCQKEKWVEEKKKQCQAIDDKVSEKIVEQKISKEVDRNTKHIELYDDSTELVEKFIEIFKKSLAKGTLKKGINPFNLEKIIACIERIQKGQRLALGIKDDEQQNTNDEPIIHIIEGIDIRKL